MEIVLLLGIGAMLVMGLKQAAKITQQMQNIDLALRAISERLSGLPPDTTAPQSEPPPATEPSPTEHGRWPIPEPPPPFAPPPMPEPATRVAPAAPTYVQLPGGLPPPPPPEAFPEAGARPFVASADAETIAGSELPPPPPEAPSEPPSAEPPPPPPPPPSSGMPDFGDLEKRFGTQWVVWVGGVALGLGGIFLVRYTIEAGLFGPGLRIIFGALLALFLVGLGELARRREIISGLDKIPNAAHIPSILTAAGTTCAYADVWAAYSLYEFLPNWAAFPLLGAVALATLAAALLHGPALGGLGLIGAYLTPALVGSKEPSYWTLYVYLVVVTTAAYALARIRLWRWLAITAGVFSVLWMFPGIATSRFDILSAHCAYAIAIYALAAYFIVAGLFEGPPTERGRSDPVSCGILAGYVFATYMLVINTWHEPMALATLFALLAATVAIAWHTEAAILAVPAAAILGTLVVLHWALSWWVVIVFPPSSLLALPPLTMPDIGLRDEHALYALATAAVFGAGGYLGQTRTDRALFRLIWAGVAVATALALLVLVYYRLTKFEQSIPFAGVALLVGGLCAAAAELLWKREPRPGLYEAGAIFAVGAVAGVALTLTFALERGWLTVGLSLMAPGIAMIAEKRPVPLLRKLCGGIAALVLARVLYDPRIVGDAIGTTPIFNWLLWGYGVPAVSFWVAGYLLRRQADDISSRSIDSAAILFTALAAFLEIRHLMNDGDIYRPAAKLGEIGLQISTGLALVIGLERMRLRSNSIVHEWSARILAALSFAGIVFGLLIGVNPLVTGEPVGGLLFNYVLLGYGIPGILMGVLARMIRNTRPQVYYFGAAVTAIVLILLYLTFEVRTIYQGPVLNTPFVSDAEDYTYSAVWLGFGVVLLIGGVLLRSQPARFASAAVLILTIGKVFIHDFGNVEGIYRALSFIGLGLVLMGIGWLYQRLLFPRRPPAQDSPAGS